MEWECPECGGREFSMVTQTTVLVSKVDGAIHAEFDEDPLILAVVAIVSNGRKPPGTRSVTCTTCQTQYNTWADMHNQRLIQDLKKEETI